MTAPTNNNNTNNNNNTHSTNNNNSNNNNNSSRNNVKIHLIGGALAGLAETLSVQPVDMIKTRQQIHQGSPVHSSMKHVMKSIVNEGGFLQFYRGVLPPVMSIVPSTCVMFVCNEQVKRLLNTDAEEQRLSVAIAAGALSGLPEAIILTPFEVVKVRLQSSEFLGRYINSWDCLHQMRRQEGVSSLFRGLWPTIYRNCVWNGAYFGLIHIVKPYLPTPQSHLDELAINFTSGAVAGTFATVFNTPFDVVKSRIQNEVVLRNSHNSSGSGSHRVYRNTIQSMLYLYRSEGYKALYKGFSAKVIRMSIGGGVGIAVFESICSLSGKIDRAFQMLSSFE